MRYIKHLLEIGRLRQEETRLTLSLSSIRSRLNNLVPVSRLPVEILEKIFSICVFWLYMPNKPKHRLAWTQVCRLWRSTSFNSPRLWQRIDLCNSRFATEFLVRSKKAPLFLVSALPLKLDTKTLSSHAERLHSIELYVFPDDMQELFANVGPYLPSLTDISLKIPPVSCQLALDISFPSVRRLTLDCVSIRWDDCQKLTYLSLRGLGPDFCPSLSQIQAIFEKSPHLEYVRLENITPSDSDRPITSISAPTSISLPYLKDMIISSKPCVISSILSTLSFESHTRLQLFSSLSDDLHTLFPYGLPYKGPSLTVSGIRLARHAAYFLRPGAAAWSEEPQKTLFSLSSSTSVALPILNSLQTLFPLSSITTLELGTGVLIDIPSNHMHTFLSHLDSLESLRIAFNNLNDILLALSSPSPSILCPSLNTLSFSKPSDLWWHFKDNWLDAVVSCAQARKLHSCPLRTVAFVRCHGMSDKVALPVLGNVVQEVLVLEHVEVRRY